jgi:hypothetical protein
VAGGRARGEPPTFEKIDGIARAGCWIERRGTAPPRRRRPHRGPSPFDDMSVIRTTIELATLESPRMIVVRLTLKVSVGGRATLHRQA